ncbi:hypothetical protein BDF22DRAFT_693866 [Syncephalis plumigaleata]|nr:hypothetical protein BDF22DRAFT_693866 [Syncephalis plumigaleata]
MTNEHRYHCAHFDMLSHNFFFLSLLIFRAMSLPAAESVPSLTANEKSSITVDTQGWDSEADDYSEDEVADFLEWEDTGEATEDTAEDASVEESSKNDSNNSTFMARILGPSANKAGLQSTDKAMITRVIYEASKGTPFFENERRKDQALRRRIEQLLERKKRLEGRDLTQIRKQVDMDWRQLEVERDLSQTIVHIDMDAFYAAVEELDNPELKTKPMAVGGNSMLSTANYVARKFGIRSAMPGYIAKKLCPELIIIPVNGAKYKAISKQVQAILERYDPQFLAAGIDESYLNLTNYMEETGMTAEEATHKIRQEIFEKTNLTASAGIAANKRLAKICSDINKPNGQYTLKNDKDVIMKFVRELPVRQLNGIGRVTEQLLGALGVTTGNDMHEHRVMLKLLLSSKSFEFISRAALGLGKTDLSVQYDRKSISVERTFRNMSDAQQQLEMLKKIADKLASNLDRKQIKGSTITLKLKRSDFTILSRSRSLAQCIFTEEDLYTQGKQLLEQEQPIDIRLMGLRISALQDMRTKQINKSITKVNT